MNDRRLSASELELKREESRDKRDAARRSDSHQRNVTWALLVMAVAAVGTAVGLAVIASGQAQLPAVLVLGGVALVTLIVGFALLGLVARRYRHAAQSDRDPDSKSLVDYLALAGLPFLVLAGGVLTYWLINSTGSSEGAGPLSSELAITFFLAFSVMALLLALSMTAIFFSWAKLADGKQALGLPEGSVRAVIALALIIIFAIAAIFLYSRVSTSSTISTPGLTQDQVDQIPPLDRISVLPDPTAVPDPAAPTPAPGATPVPVVQTFTVVRVDPAQARGDDLAQQIVTTVSTLVVAVSAFYFGTSAVKSAVEAVGLGAGKNVRVVAPRPPVKLRRTGDDAWESVEIDVEATPTSQALEGQIMSGDPKGGIAQLQPGHFRYRPNEPESLVVLRFSLVGDAAVTTTLLVNQPTDEESEESVEADEDLGPEGGGGTGGGAIRDDLPDDDGRGAASEGTGSAGKPPAVRDDSEVGPITGELGSEAEEDEPSVPPDDGDEAEAEAGEEDSNSLASQAGNRPSETPRAGRSSRTTAHAKDAVDEILEEESDRPNRRSGGFFRAD